MNMVEFVILALAVWRCSSLLANEPGPWKVFERFRDWVCAKDFQLGEGLTCEWCNSVWIGTVATLMYFAWRGTIWLALPMAMSTVTILIKFIRERLER
jgi:hypothetical protein